MRKLIRQGRTSLSNSSSVLIDLPQGLGDQIMCFPLFASLKKAYPSAVLTALTLNGGSQALLGMNKNIDAVKSFPMSFTMTGVLRFFLRDFAGMYRFFRHSKFDLVIVVHHNKFRRLLYMLLPKKGMVYNLEHVHKGLECRNVLNALSITPVYSYTFDPGDDDAFLEKNGLEKGKYILLDLYAQHLDRDPRQWFGFGRLIDILINEKCSVVAAGLNAGHKKDFRIVDLVNNTNFKELLILIKNARLVVAQDSGIFHFSYALGVPVLGLYGPVNPADRIPFGDGHHVKVLYSELSCSPCIKNKVDIECINPDKYSCMKSILPETVIDEIRKMIGSFQ